MIDGVAAYTRSLDCVHCGLCLETCPTYRVLGLETDSPRGRIYLMRALAEGRIADPDAIAPHFDRCLGCRACETACPSGVRYGSLLEAVRAQQTEGRPLRGFGPRLRRFLLTRVVADQPRLRLAFRLARTAELLGLRRVARWTGLLRPAADRLVPRVPPAHERRPLYGVHPARGERRGRVHLFTGCVMEQVFGRINRATLRLLTDNGFDVVVPPAQTCCGALHAHDGHATAAADLARRNVTAFADAEIVVNNSAGCGAALRDYGDALGDDAGRAFAAKCRDITEFLADVGLRERPQAFPHPVAYDAPCHLCHGQRVRTQPAELLRQVPDLELVSHPTGEECCGSAGIYNLLQPELASTIGREKVERLLATGARWIATGNPGCMMQIAAHLREVGAAAGVVHPVELLLSPRAAREGDR